MKSSSHQAEAKDAREVHTFTDGFAEMAARPRRP
jgi:hypothetical protein